MTTPTVQTRCRAMAAVLMGALVLPAALSAQQPTRPPAPGPLRPVRFPAFVNQSLPNGISIIVVERREQPIVSIGLSFAAGSFHDPADRAGLAAVTAGVLTKGTATRTADQIAEQIESAGGGIGAGADDDFLQVNVSALSDHTERAFELLADVVRNATFPASEVELARTQSLSGLRANLAQPSFIAGRIFTREVYAAHPYGRWTTSETLGAITQADVARFAAERIRPGGALLVVAGDVRAADVLTIARRTLGDWTGGSPAAAAAPTVTPPARTEVVLVHKPGAVQSNIVAGFPFITPRDPAAYALTLMNRVLGGGADSRLFMILREEKGWTYGAYSGFSRPRGVGAFQATAEVRTEVTDSALAELVRQLSRMRTEVPADSELAGARNYLVGRFPLQIETAEEVANRVANARLLGLPDDYVQRYRERLSAVTRTQFGTAARRYLTTDRMMVVVVGDGPRILAGLKAQGMPVRIVDTEGRPLTEADLSPRASGVAFLADRVTAGTQRYRILVQGNPFGEETRTISRVQEGGRDAWQVITNTNLGPIVRQADTTVVDAATLLPIRVRQGGAVQGQPTFVRLDYAEGRVRGSARAPQGPGQMRDLTIDTTVIAGTLDDNQIALVMSALPYAASARWSMPVFSGGQGQTRSYQISVVGEETITVPAGTIACWKVEVTGSEQPVTMYVSKDAPFGVVKMELSGMPVAFELVQRN